MKKKKNKIENKTEITFKNKNSSGVTSLKLIS